MKFGGSSVAGDQQIKQATSLVKKYLPSNQIVVVVSAMRGITDQLIELMQSYQKGHLLQGETCFQQLSKRHFETTEKTIRKVSERNETVKNLKSLLDELKKVLQAIYYLRELTPKSRDYVLSFGERLSALIFNSSLQDIGINSKYYTGGDSGIVTDNNFGDARPLINITTHRVKRKLSNLLETGIIPVVTGFIGVTQNGEITTLGRGGSDYSATILGTALKVDEVWIWSDVNGIMTSDPKIVPNAKAIRMISYQEAIEMAIFGAKAMHPQCLEPAIEFKIPVRIRNTFNSKDPGTLIINQQEKKTKHIVKTVALIKNVSIINICGASMVGKPGTAASIFDTLGKNDINILMISQSVSEANISLVVRSDMAQRAVNALEIALLGRSAIQKISLEDDVNIVAAVGAGMRGTPGVAKRIFSTIAQYDINVKMIAQGSSELNISFAVNKNDGEKAVKMLHEEFQLHKTH